MGKWKWLLGAGAVASVAEYGLANYFFRRTIKRKHASKGRTQNMAGTNWDLYIPQIIKNKEWLMTLPMEDVTILSRDGLKLHGTFIPAESSDEPEKIVLCFHGYTSEGLNDYTSLSKFYHSLGYQLMIVDERGHGKSEGEYIGFGCLDRYDALSWIQYLENRFSKNQQVILHGISMGGATVLMTSGLDLPDTVKAIISDCAFTSAWDVFSSVLKTQYHLPSFPIMQISNAITKKEAGYRLDECNAAEEVKKAKVPILFIHGDQDTFVPFRMCHELFENCSSPKAFLAVEGAGHAEAYYKETSAYEAAIKDFLSTGGTVG